MMQLCVTEAAAHSIVEQADYLLENAGSQVADQWETNVDQALRSLLQFPERGALCRFTNPDLASLRWIAIPGFSNHLLFYRVQQQDATVLIVQLLHGARKLEALLDEGK